MGTFEIKDKFYVNGEPFQIHIHQRLFTHASKASALRINWFCSVSLRLTK